MGCPRRKSKRGGRWMKARSIGASGLANAATQVSVVVTHHPIPVVVFALTNIVPEVNTTV